MRILIVILALMASISSSASVNMPIGSRGSEVSNCPICYAPEIIKPDEVEFNELANTLEVELRHKGELIDAFTADKSDFIQRQYENGDVLTLNINHDSVGVTILQENQAPINYFLESN